MKHLDGGQVKSRRGPCPLTVKTSDNGDDPARHCPCDGCSSLMAPHPHHTDVDAEAQTHQVVPPTSEDSSRSGIRFVLSVTTAQATRES